MTTYLDTAALWEMFNAPLRGFILTRVSDAAAAEDILQDVFIKVHLGMSRLREEAKLQSWLYQIARNAIADYYRRRRQEAELFEALQLPIEPDNEPACDLRTAVARIVAALPEDYRQALVWDVQGMAQKEIALRLGISLSGAKSRVQRGRQKVKQALMGCCHFEFDRFRQVIDCRPHLVHCQTC